MANLVLKPSTGAGNSVIVKDQAGGAVLTTADSGATIANATLASPMVTGNISIPNDGNIGSAGDADAISISSAGYVINSARPYFSVYGNQAGTGTDVSANARIPFNTTTNNNGSHFNTTGHYFTTPIAGVYYFRVQIYHYSGTNTIAYEMKSHDTSDGDSFALARLRFTPGGSDNIYFISASSYLAANRRISVVNNVGATRTVYLQSAESHTVFQGCLIG